MFNKLTLSYSNTAMGFWLCSFIIPLIVLDITQSALFVSISYALNILPYILVTPFAGVLGDKYNKKKIILIGELSCLILATFIFFLPFDTNYIYLIIFSGFLIACFSAIHHPIFQAIIPELYHSQQIPKINSNIGVIDSFVAIFAPILAGLLLANVDKKYIILAISACYFLSFLIFITISYLENISEKNKNLKTIEAIKEGFSYVNNKKDLKNIVMLFFGMNFGIRVIFPNLMWIFSVMYHSQDDKIALYFLIIGIGSIIGAKSASYIIGKIEDKIIIKYSTLTIGMFSFMLLLSNNGLMLSILWGLSSFFQSVIIVTFFTYRQKITETFILSRVVSVTRLISYLAIPPATLLSGIILNNGLNISLIYAISGSVILISLLLFVIFDRKN